MRSADALRLARVLRLVAVAGMAALVVACSAVSEPLNAVRQAMTPGPSAANPSRSAQNSGPPISPEVQRTFDEANALLRAGRADEAERAFRALAQAQPELAGPHANLGVIQRRAGKLPEAMAELEQAVRLSPRQPIYLNQLGVTYRQAGQFDKARDAYQQAIALDARYAPAVLNLGILYDLYYGDSARALELYGRYLAIGGGDATVTKWVADLRNRKSAPVTVSRKEKE